MERKIICCDICKKEIKDIKSISYLYLGCKLQKDLRKSDFLDVCNSCRSKLKEVINNGN